MNMTMVMTIVIINDGDDDDIADDGDDDGEDGDDDAHFDCGCLVIEPPASSSAITTAYLLKHRHDGLIIYLP